MRKPFMIALLLTLVAACTSADASYPLAPGEFGNLHDAVEAAFAQGVKLSRMNEIGGLILRSVLTQRFRYTVPITDGHATSVDIAVDGEYPGYRVIADYHTHPCVNDPDDTKWFSNSDTRGNQMERTLGFMLDECTGLVHVYDPLHDKVDDDDGETEGRIVGKVAP